MLLLLLLLFGNSKILIFTPIPGEMIQLDEDIFLNGLVGPPACKPLMGRFLGCD